MKITAPKFAATLALASLFALSACSKDDAAAPAAETPASAAKKTDNPVEAVNSVMAKLKANDLAGVAALMLPPAKLDELRTKWTKEKTENPASAEDKAKFAEQMAKFTAADAETALYAELEPLLVKFDTEMAPQLPMMVGMGQGFAMQALNENKDMNEAQKKQATETLGALAGWAQTAKFGDRELAKKGIAVAVKTARDLNLKTLDEVEALDFDGLLGKAGIVFGGIKNVAALYGIDMDASLASAKTSLVSQEGDAAKVATTYNFLGKQITNETDLVQVEGRWYGKESLDAVFEAMAGGDEPEVADGADGETEAEEEAALAD